MEGRRRRGREKRRRVFSVNKEVDVLIPRLLDREPGESRGRLFPSRSLSPSVVREDGSKLAEKPRETVIIKSCNQLANLSSSVLIKPGPVISLSLFSSPFPVSNLLLSFPPATYARETILI